MAELTCRELIDFLDDYFAGTQTAEVRAEFDRHIGICPPCKDYLKTYSATIEVTRRCCEQDPSAPPPEDAPEQLINAILAAKEQRDG